MLLSRRLIVLLLTTFGCIFICMITSNLESATIKDPMLMQVLNSELPTVSVLLSMSELKLKNKSAFHRYIKDLSDSDLNKLAENYHVTGLTSTALQRTFMACPGYFLLKHFSNAKGEIQTPKHQTCKNMSFQTSGTPVALVSWPGSGNSWVRQLLETTTGIYTGGVDCDFAYYRAGMIGEGIVSNNVIVVKSHWEPPSWNFTNKILYIVRNPFDAFVADWNREQAHSHVGIVNASYFGNNSKWDKRVKNSAYWWRVHMEQWTTEKHVTHVVKYEKLFVDLKTELQKMLDFLGHPYTEADFNCTIHSSTKQFHRNHSYRALDKYTQEQKAAVNKQLKIANIVLQKFKSEYQEQW